MCIYTHIYVATRENVKKFSYILKSVPIDTFNEDMVAFKPNFMPISYHLS